MSDEDGPLNIENGDPYQDIYYIHEFKMLPNYDNEFLKNRIIEELPGLILKLLHVAPDIIAYYPAPLEYEPDPDKEFRYDTLQAIVAQRLNSLTNSIDVDEKEKQDIDKKILKFGDIYQFSDDEIISWVEEIRGHLILKKQKIRRNIFSMKAMGFKKLGIVDYYIRK